MKSKPAERQFRRLRLHSGPRTIARTRGPAGRAALRFYRPQSWRGKALGMLARSLADTPLGEPYDLDPTLHEHIDQATQAVDGVGVAVMSSSREHRWIAGVTAHRGQHAVAKIALKEEDGLRDEIDILSRGLHGRGWRAPEILHADYRRRALVMRFESGHDEKDPAAALRICQDLQRLGLVHGDLAPWNILRTVNDHVILDWETGRRDTAWPGHDLIHFHTKRSMLLESQSAHHLVRELASPDGYLAQLLAPLNVDPRDAIDRYVTHAHDGDNSPIAIGYRAAMGAALRESTHL